MCTDVRKRNRVVQRRYILIITTVLISPLRLESKFRGSSAQGLWNCFLAWSQKQEIHVCISRTPFQIEYSDLPSLFPHFFLIRSCRVHLTSSRERALRYTSGQSLP